MKFSYWENKTWLSNIDFVIVGSGIVGLNCALELRSKHPKRMRPWPHLSWGLTSLELSSLESGRVGWVGLPLDFLPSHHSCSPLVADDTPGASGWVAS